MSDSGKVYYCTKICWHLFRILLLIDMTKLTQFAIFSIYRSSPVTIAVSFETDASGKSNRFRIACFICYASVASNACYYRERIKTKCYIPFFLSRLSALNMNVEKQWERSPLYSDTAPVGDRRSGRCRKVWVPYRGRKNFFEVSFVWP